MLRRKPSGEPSKEKRIVFRRATLSFLGEIPLYKMGVPGESLLLPILN